MRSALLVLACALVAMPARAQSNDARWEPWLGCWTLAVENQRDGEPQDADARQRTPRPSATRDGAPRVCVTRTPTGGARFETTVNTQVAVDQTIVADGAPHPVNETDCSGTQRAEWSKNGLRLFSSADIRCQGDPDPRRVSGLSLIAPNGDWLDIQTIATGNRETIRVKRYYRDPDSSRFSRPSVASSSLTLDEVAEASGKVSPGALEAALVETGAGFNLTSKNLLRLDSAGVPPRIIDLLVALSYPEKFVVQRTTPGGASFPHYRDPFAMGWGFGYPYYASGYYGSPYYYEPFGWRGYSVFDSGVVLVPVEPGGGSDGPVRSGSGRVVNGQGYTRVIPRESAPGSAFPSDSTSGSTASGSRSATPSSSSSDSSSGSSGSGSSGSSGSSGGGTASPTGGYSSGGSSDSGRTAVP